MKKKDLQKAAGLIQHAMLKVGRGEDVSTGIFRKIRLTLEVTPENIIEFISSAETQN